MYHNYLCINIIFQFALVICSFFGFSIAKKIWTITPPIKQKKKFYQVLRVKVEKSFLSVPNYLF